MRSKNNSRHGQYFFSLLLCGVFLSGDLSQGQQADRPTDSLPNAPKPNVVEKKGFFARWAGFYRQDWSGTAASSPAPDDKKGQRTGYATRYLENTITWCHWIGTTIQIRPELRFERAWDLKAYDNGRRHNQLTVASDLIFHF